MERGIVKWFDQEKKYGFLQSDTGGKEFFVHASEVKTMSGMLEQGQRVQFEIGEGQKGPVARNVESLEEDS